MNHPLGGKTGTTSDFTDAWFLGFSPSVTCGVWVGYDSNQSLGEKETGAKAALPIWMTFMRDAIAGKDDEQFLGDESNAPIAAVKVHAHPGFPAAGIAGKRSLLPGAGAADLGRGGGKAASAPASGAAANSVRAIAPARRHAAPALPVTPAKSPARPALKPQVKPALPAPPAPARPAPAVQPALGSIR